MSGRSVSRERGRSRLEGLLLLDFWGSFVGCYLGGISYSCSQARLCCQTCQVCEALELELESELVFRAVFPSEAQGCALPTGLVWRLCQKYMWLPKAGKAFPKKMLPLEWCQLTIVIVLGKGNTICCGEGSRDL